MIFKRTRPGSEIDENGSDGPQLNPSAEPSYIARDVVIEGNISTEGEIHIDGELRGSIRAATCLIDVNGVVNGGVFSNFVMIRGRVFGPINAGRLSIQKGAHVEGNVVHEGISIEHGAFVMGTITQNGAIPEAHTPVPINLGDTAGLISQAPAPQDDSFKE